MTTANNIKGQNLDINEELITALYCRLSVEDIKDDKDKKRKNKEDESNSISNQKQILLDYCKRHGYKNTMFFVDDGISGTSFDRSDFNRMQKMVEEGKICRIIVKDLSRFGREQVEAGRLAQIVYPSLGVTFISIQENVKSTTGEGMEMLPFYNIFNEWYAAQTSKKIRAVWQSKADNGKRISSTVPYGYVRDAEDKEKWLKKTVADSKIRLAELDKLMAKLYEDNVLGRVKDDFYEMMMKNYEREQKELTKVVIDGDLVLQSSEQKSADTRLLIRTFREMTDITELTPIIVNKLIERIEVHNNDKSSGHCYVKVDIYFTGVGMISIPSAEELIAMMEDIQKNPEAHRLAA
ncbi:MAG: recombinase family protein [Clostridia bacterium]|nr:recombinase family protein [Clostridia bacterium]